MQRRDIKRYAKGLLIILIGVACAFVSQMVLAKILTAEQYGIFSFIFSCSLLMAVFSLFGFQNSSIKFLSIFYDSNTLEARQFIKFSRTICFALSLTSPLLFYGGLYLLGLDEKYGIWALGVGCILVPLMTLMRLHAAYLRGFGKPGLSVFFETSFRELLLLVFVCLAALIWSAFETGIQALWLLLAALIIANIFAALKVRQYKPAGDGAAPYPTKEKQTEWMKTTLPMAFVIFAQRILRRGDIIIIGLMLSPALLGAYAIVAQFSEACAIGQKNIFAIFSAEAAKLHDQKNKDDLRKRFRSMQKLGIFTTLLFVVPVLIIAPYLLSYFGEGYDKGYMALVILLIGMVLNIAVGPVGILMLMTGLERDSARLTLTTGLANILCLPVAIHYFGLEGAAFVTSFFLVFRAFLSRRIIHQKGIL